MGFSLIQAKSELLYVLEQSLAVRPIPAVKALVLRDAVLLTAVQQLEESRVLRVQDLPHFVDNSNLPTLRTMTGNQRGR